MRAHYSVCFAVLLSRALILYLLVTKEVPSKKLRLLKRLLWSLLAALLLFLGTIFVVLRYFEDDVVKYAVDYIDERLATNAKVGSVDLTFWETFPHASLAFTDVYVPETFPEKDTLFFASTLYLEFSLIDLFRGNYNIRAVSANDARANLKLNEKGEDNWHFWKPSADTSSFALHLTEVKLDNASIVYEDRSSKFFTDAMVNSALISGDFESEQYTLGIELEALLHSLYGGNTEFIHERNVTLALDLSANNATSLYQFTKGDIAIDDLPLVVTGEVKGGDKGSLNLNIDGQNLALEEVLDRLPKAYQQGLAKYSTTGDVIVHASIKGASNAPAVNASFALSNGEFRERDSGTSLQDIALKGSYIAPAKGNDVLKIDQLDARLETGQFSATGSLTRLASPIADITVTTKAELSALKNFFAWDTLEVCEGSIDATARLQGQLKYVELDSTMDWSAVQTTGQAQLTNAHFRLVNSTRDFTNVNGQVELTNKTAFIRRFGGTVNGSDFLLTGEVSNLLSFLTTRSERLGIRAQFNAQLIDFGNLVESSSSNDAYHLVLPPRVDCELNSNIREFRFGKFVARDIRGLIRIQRGDLVIDPVAFNTAEGSLSTRVAMATLPDGNFQVSSISEFNNINIQQLFTEFDNFGQTFITDKHLRGKANAKVSIDMPMSSSLRIDQNRLIGLIDIAIDNGQLIGLESLQEVAAYLRNNKWAAPFVNTDKLSERLKDIRFSRLENVIEIRNRNITIPQMDIRSSAMDISVQGKHNFDNNIDYTIGFRLRDILVQKMHENEMDDGLGRLIYVYMRGNTSDPQFGIDKDAAKQNRQQQIAAEKQNVKALLKEEFGLFRNDPTVGTYKEAPQQTQTTTTIQWDGFDEAQPSTTTTHTAAPPTAPKPEPEKPKEESTTGKKVPKWLREKDDVKVNPH